MALLGSLGSNHYGEKWNEWFGLGHILVSTEGSLISCRETNMSCMQIVLLPGKLREELQRGHNIKIRVQLQEREHIV